MAAHALQSKAFERASLKSESYRVVALICVLAGITIFVVVRGIAMQNYLLLIAQSVVLVFVIALQDCVCFSHQIVQAIYNPFCD